jgi:hypothetical protein
MLHACRHLWYEQGAWVGGEMPGDVVGWVVDPKGVARAAVIAGVESTGN